MTNGVTRMVDVNLERHTPGAMGMDFLEPDPEFLKPSASIEGNMIAKGLALALERAGIPPRVGDRFQVLADENGNVNRVIFRYQELNVG